jgi:hypothetical protein
MKGGGILAADGQPRGSNKIGPVDARVKARSAGQLRVK